MDQAHPPRPLLEARGLTRRYDDHLAVNAASLVVHPGEVVALLGPNGAGKTTFLRMLFGVLQPDAGEAFVDGISVKDDPLAARALIGFASGDTHAYGRLTVREMLRYFGRLFAMEASALTAAIEAVSSQFGLTEFIDQKTAQLSSGQTQRANLARAFVTDPRVLILDEPTTALDVVSGRFVHEAIRRARSERRAVLLSTHDLDEAGRLADRVALLVRGEIVDAGSPAELLARHGVSDLAELVVRLHEASV